MAKLCSLLFSIISQLFPFFVAASSGYHERGNLNSPLKLRKREENGCNAVVPRSAFNVNLFCIKLIFVHFTWIHLQVYACVMSLKDRLSAFPQTRLHQPPKIKIKFWKHLSKDGSDASSFHYHIKNVKEQMCRVMGDRILGKRSLSYIHITRLETAGQCGVGYFPVDDRQRFVACQRCL